MANAVSTQTILDGDRNVVVKLVGILDTSNESSVVKVDVANLAPVPTSLRLVKVGYSTSSQLTVVLYWEATADVPILTLYDSGEFEFCRFQGLPNNAGTGVTGNVKLATLGWASGTQTYSVVLEFQKIYS